MKGKKIKTKIAEGVIYSVGMRWSMKLIGLINTVILARLLTPDDFGIVAIAMLFLGLITEMATLNIALLLIRVNNNSREHNDSAWTVSIVQSILVCVLMILLAPLASSYFEDQRVIEVIYWFAFMKIISGFTNVGVILARKELDFSFDFRFMVYSRLIRFFIVLFLAFSIKNYWALVYGAIISEIAIVILSYKMHSYRPSINFKYFSEYMSFAINMIPLSIAKLLNNKIDVIILGRGSTTAQIGVYNIANELSSMFTKELILPASRGLYPNLSLLKQDRKEFSNTFLSIISAALMISLPIGCGLMVLSDSIVSIILGNQWKDSAAFIKWLAFAGAIEAVTFMISEHPLIALGFEKLSNRLMWMRLLVLSACISTFIYYYGFNAVAIGVFVSSIINFPIISMITFRKIGIPNKHILRLIIPPLFSTLVLLIVATYTKQLTIPIGNDFVTIVVVAITGIITYLLTSILIWIARGKPAGLEQYLYSKISNFITQSKS